MAEYWLISAPGDKTMQQTWETMNNVTSKQNNLCVNYKFHIPDLKVSVIDYGVVFFYLLARQAGFISHISNGYA